jgi:modulator of FtsH protease
MLESWDSFFVAETAAAAALLGLLFVAISINLKQVLEAGGLTDRALGALLLLLAILILGLLMSMPDQSLAVLGIETIGTCVVTGVIGTILGLRGLRLADKEYSANFFWNVVSFLGVLVVIIIGGALMFSGGEAGFYWIGVGMCLALIKAVSEGWIFLVEINR